jgi:hypothetical protein
MAMVPSFRNMRLFAFLALAGTTYTSWCAGSHNTAMTAGTSQLRVLTRCWMDACLHRCRSMMAQSWSHGLQGWAASRPPLSLQDTFAGKFG